MGKKKKKNFRCSSCGFECETEDQLLTHCGKEHPEDYMLPFMMIGKFVNLEQATIAFKARNMDYHILIGKIDTLTSENKKKDARIDELTKAHNIYTTAANSIMNTMHLLGDALAPIRGTDRHGS